MKKNTIELEMTKKEIFASILAGIRALQQGMEMNGGMAPNDFKDHFTGMYEPSVDTLDQLCEAINFGEIDLKFSPRLKLDFAK